MPFACLAYSDQSKAAIDLDLIMHVDHLGIGGAVRHSSGVYSGRSCSSEDLYTNIRMTSTPQRQATHQKDLKHALALALKPTHPARKTPRKQRRLRIVT